MLTIPVPWFVFMLDLEGTGLVHENGVRSFCGINEKWNPEWAGWKWVGMGEYGTAFEYVFPFYRGRWETVKAGMLKGELGLHYFDFAFNSGGRAACTNLQSVLNVDFDRREVTLDGLMGPVTAKAAAEVDRDEVLMRYAIRRIEWLTDVDKKEYRRGWLRRVGRVVSR